MRVIAADIARCSQRVIVGETSRVWEGWGFAWAPTAYGARWSTRLWIALRFSCPSATMKNEGLGFNHNFGQVWQVWFAVFFCDAKKH